MWQISGLYETWDAVQKKTQTLIDKKWFSISSDHKMTRQKLWSREKIHVLHTNNSSSKVFL